MVQRARLNFDQNFVCLDRRIGRVGVLQNFRPTVLFEDDSFHE
jgi:hypothetical protein